MIKRSDRRKKQKKRKQKDKCEAKTKNIMNKY